MSDQTIRRKVIKNSCPSLFQKQEFSNRFHNLEMDYTLFFRQLTNNNVRDLFLDRESFNRWQMHYDRALEKEPTDAKLHKKRMVRVNPKYILRNFMLQITTEKATIGDYSEIDKLFTL